MDIQYDTIMFPTVSDYPEEMFDISSPKGYRVGCGKAYLDSNVIAKRFQDKERGHPPIASKRL